MCPLGLTDVFFSYLLCVNGRLRMHLKKIGSKDVSRSESQQVNSVKGRIIGHGNIDQPSKPTLMQPKTFDFSLIL